MPKDDCPRWFKRFAAISVADPMRLVGHMRGCITLTRCTITDLHTLWIYDYPVCDGPAEAMRAEYEKFRLTR